jgi:Nitrile hydratase, alpha chain
MSNQDKIPERIAPNLPLWSYQLQQDSKLAVKTRKDLEIHLITRALKDEGFRQELVANPKTVVEKELGVKLPEELEIKVLQETENTFYMVLPSNPYERISEEELKASVGMTYEDVAQWVLEQQRNALLDEESGMRVIARAWRDETFKEDLFYNPIQVIETELKEKIEKGIEIKILTETANTLYIVLSYIKLLDIFDILDLKKDMVSEINMPILIGSGGIGMCSSRCVKCPDGNWTCQLC